MTPRTLLTTIGATAVAFAVAIGVAAGSSNGAIVPQSGRMAIAASAAADRVSSYEWSAGTSVAGERLSSLNDPCVIAV